MIEVKVSISYSHWFDKQSEVAFWLGIRNSSKKAISSRCKQCGYGVEFDNYYGDYNLECTR